MSSRTMILEKLKAAGRPGRINREIMPPVGTRPGDVEVFVQKAMAAAAQVIRTNAAEVPQAVRETLTELGCKTLLLSDEEIIKEYFPAAAAEEMGIEAGYVSELPADEYRRSIFRTDAGMSGCDYALADSGTIVIRHDGDNQRLLSLAPDYYIALVKTSQMLKDRFDLAGILEKEKTAAVTLITGVSRTADVALQVVLGMHGPRKVYIILIDD